MNKRIGLLLLFSLLFSGCRSLPFVNSSQVPKSTPVPLALEPCTVAGIEAECGTLQVPEDRSKPNGRILDLKVIVVPAKEPDHEPDPLIYLVGGPGVAATGPGVVSAGDIIFGKINARRDIIYLDQRGTNDRHRLTCENPSFSFPEATQQQVYAWIRECLSSLDGDPRFYTTAEAMRDLDEARAALGYDKINLYGISYGTTAAQVYMRLFPEHVRTAVLDHGTALDVPFIYVKPRASQAALDQLFTYCEQDQQCHAAYPDIRGDWEAILNRLAKGPVVTSYIPPGSDSPAQVDMDQFAGGMHSLLFNSGAYAMIPSLLHTLAVNEDWTPIIKSLNEQYGSSAPAEPYLLMPDVIFCFEPSWGYNPHEVTRLSPDSYYRDLMVQWARNEQKLCAALPPPGRTLIYGRGKPLPLNALMLNGLLDAQNPPSNMEPALKEFTKSRLIVEPIASHENLLSDHCRWDIITQYIQQGLANGLDISCMENQKPSFVIGD